MKRIAGYGDSHYAVPCGATAAAARVGGACQYPPEAAHYYQSELC